VEKLGELGLETDGVGLEPEPEFIPPPPAQADNISAERMATAQVLFMFP
jgi:hypothetical protein